MKNRKKRIKSEKRRTNAKNELIKENDSKIKGNKKTNENNERETNAKNNL